MSVFRDDAFAGHKWRRLGHSLSLKDRRSHFECRPARADMLCRGSAGCGRQAGLLVFPVRVIGECVLRALLLEMIWSLWLRHHRRLLHGPIDSGASCGLDCSAWDARCFRPASALPGTAGAFRVRKDCQSRREFNLLESLAPRAAGFGPPFRFDSPSFAR